MHARIFTPTFLDIPFHQTVSHKMLVIIQHTAGIVITIFLNRASQLMGL